MPELHNVRVWWDPNTGRLQVTAQGDPAAHHVPELKHVTLRFEYGHGSSVENSIKAYPKQREHRSSGRRAVRVESVPAGFEREVQWAHQVSKLDGTWTGDEVTQADERAAHISAAIVRKQIDPAVDRVDVICRDVWTWTTDWRKADAE